MTELGNAADLDDDDEKLYYNVEPRYLMGFLLVYEVDEHGLADDELLF